MHGLEVHKYFAVWRWLKSQKCVFNFIFNMSNFSVVNATFPK
jgi:hypothetical protein